MPDARSLLISERSGAVAVVDAAPEGQDSQRREIWGHGRWPSWSPAGDLVLHSTILPAGEAGKSAIAATRMDGQGHVLLHESEPGVMAFIAPNVPHYALWAPGGDAVSYVAVSGQGLGLFLSTLDGATRSHRIALGAPIFHSWSPDGTRIAVHAGTDLALFDRQTLQLTGVHQAAVGFRAPAFLRGGRRLVYATSSGAGEVVLLSYAMDGATEELARFRGGVAFTARPGGTDLAVAVASGGDGGAFRELWLVHGDGSGPELLAPGPFLAFWWAPDGERIALLVPTNALDMRMCLHCRSADGRLVAVSEAFLPSEDYRVAVAFFDQYAQSHPAWSPDSSSLAVAGRSTTDGVSSSFGDQEGDYVMTWAAERRAPLGLVSPGTFGSFPPAPRPLL
jgi:TolB protein